MKLHEFEGKALLKSVGIPMAEHRIATTIEEAEKSCKEWGSVVIKAQTLSGKRGKAGLIAICNNIQEAKEKASKILGSVNNNEKIEKLILEMAVSIEKEYYVSITYDTNTRCPLVAVSLSGGIDVEENKNIITFPIDMTVGFHNWMARDLLIKAGFVNRSALKAAPILTKMYECFLKYDCKLIEINPLAESDGDIYALDAKIVLDDDALFRHLDLNLKERSDARKLTEKEILARSIDKNDHRGSAGSNYVDLDGDIAILASGGGASFVCMDAMLAYGGKPANFVEYSGNPPPEKVEKLTEITLSKPNLNGCWVVGGTANFTDIYETLMGFVKGLRKINPKPNYPILIRRGGPRDKEAFEALKIIGEKEGYDFHIFGSETPMTETAKTMVELVEKYKEGK